MAAMAAAITAAPEMPSRIVAAVVTVAALLAVTIRVRIRAAQERRAGVVTRGTGTAPRPLPGRETHGHDKHHHENNQKRSHEWFELFLASRLPVERESLIFFKMLRFQWLGNGVFAGEPFPQVNQLAPMRTKRTILAGEPITGLSACRAFDRSHGSRGLLVGCVRLLGLSHDLFEVRHHIDRIVQRGPAVRERLLNIRQQFVLLGVRQV